MPESKQDETFKVVDRRLFSEDGEFRKDIAEQQDRDHEAASAAGAAQVLRNAAAAPGAVLSGTGSSKPESAVTQPGSARAAEGAGLSNTNLGNTKRSVVFENLIRSLGQNAAMLLGGYADPQTGQPMLDLDGAREMIDMLDVLREKTKGNLAPEEDSLMVDVVGNLKLAFMEMTKAAAAAAQQEKAKVRK